MAFPTAEILNQRLSPLVASHNLDIEELKATPAGKKSQVIVRVDGDIHPSSDTLETLTLDISAFLDDLEAKGELNFGAGYTLEVSTPGVDLPLELPRHFRRNRGRLIDKDGQVFRLGAMNDAETSIVLLKTVKKEIHFEIAQIDKLTGAVVKIEFAKPSEAETQASALSYEEAEKKAARED